MYATVHRKMISEVFIPENCMMVLDERLLHAGTESVLCGYSPTHSPRYLVFLHHKDRKVSSYPSFDEVKYCSDDCKLCCFENTNKVFECLEDSLKELEIQFDERDLGREQNDYVAGDLSVLGWEILRNGVEMNRDFDRRLGHEFQTILLTKKFTGHSVNSAWYEIHNSEDRKQVTIPYSFRSYMFPNDSRLRQNCSLVYGSRKMLPYLREKNGSNIDWFEKNYCNNIAFFFKELEKKITGLKFKLEYGKNKEIEGNNMSRFLGNPKFNCEDFELSGQCIVANFGFVREQGMHMNYDWNKKVIE